MPDRSGAPAPPTGQASAFHVKGIIYRGTQIFFDERVPGGMQALVSAIGEPELAAFIQQPFLSASFYDALPIAALIRCEARAMSLPVAQYLDVRTRFQAEKDIGTVYKFLLKLVSLEQVAQRVPRIITQLFDFGVPVVEVVEQEHVTLRIEGWPAALVEWARAAFGVYLETALRLSGAKQARAVIHARGKSPPRGGVDCVTLAAELFFS